MRRHRRATPSPTRRSESHVTVRVAPSDEPAPATRTTTTDSEVVRREGRPGADGASRSRGAATPTDLEVDDAFDVGFGGVEVVGVGAGGQVLPAAVTHDEHDH